jgi:hypothetical protein
MREVEGRSRLLALPLWLLLAFLAPAGAVAAPSNPPSVTIVFMGSEVPGSPVYLKGYRVLAPLVHGGEVLSPMRTMLNYLSATARYDPRARTITIAGRGHRLLLTVDKRRAIFDGKKVSLSVPPEVFRGYVVVPLRAVAEQLGATVSWTEINGTVIVDVTVNRAVASPSPSPPPCCAGANAWWQISRRWLLLLSLLVAEAVAFGWVIRYLWRRGLKRVILVQILLGWLGIVGATLRAFPVALKKDEQYPVADGLTQAWLLLFIVAFFLPRILKLKILNAEFEIKDETKTTSALLTETAENLAYLLQNWTQGLAIFYALYAPAERDARKVLVYNFVRDRLGEAREWLGATVVKPTDEELVQPIPENVRLAVWLFDAKANQLRFFHSNEITDEVTRTKAFRPGEGLAGQAFLEGRLWNVADARSVPGFVEIGGAPKFGAVMCVPIYLQERGRPLGLLTIDKQGRSEFVPTAEEIAQALAALIALVWREAGVAPR